MDYKDAFSSLANLLGLEVDVYREYSTPQTTAKAATTNKTTQTTTEKTAKNDPKTPENKPGLELFHYDPEKAEKIIPQDDAEAGIDYTEYYDQCCERLKDITALLYLRDRSIPFHIAAIHHLGYDPEWISPTAVRRKQAEGKDWKPEPTRRLIIPVTTSYYIARAVDPDVDPRYQKMNEGTPDIFNERVLYRGPDTVFVVEGAIDALSVESCYHTAIALNSTSNARKLLKKLKDHATQATLILCLDNDDSGKKTTEVLRKGLTELNIRFIIADINGGYKDPNEHLTENYEGFKAALRKAEEQAEQIQPAAEPVESIQEPAPEEKALEEKAPEGEQLPGMLTYNDAVNIFQSADDRIIKFKSFPTFGKTAKIKLHDSVVIAADTGVGKSSLAINFLNDLNNDYPCIYINLEMDIIDVLRRLTAIYSGLELDRIEGYRNDEKTADAVNISLKAITERKPLQVIQGAYILEDIEEIIRKSTKDREEPTIVFIDHSLLVDTQKNTGGRYDRFTQVSEGLRKMALRYNIILFVLLQQNRAGKADDNERPKNSSLKESGSWENDSTQIIFLWYDPIDRRKKLLLTKNRHGEGGEFLLNYWKKTQTYTEVTTETPKTAPAVSTEPYKQTRREKQKQKLITAFEDALITTGGHPTIQAMAEAADVTTSTIKSWIKEYGGCTVDGVQQDPAGINTTVDYTGFIKLTPADNSPFDENENPLDTSKKQEALKRKALRDQTQ